MEHTNCAICNLDETRKLFNGFDYITGDSFKIVSCKKCGLTYINPRPDNKEMEKYYPDNYYGKRRPLLEKYTILSRMRKIEKEVQKRSDNNVKRILDIGCGRGLMLSEFKKKGWEVFGTELSEYSCELARNNFNIEVIKGDVELHEFPENSFDVITMWHVFEHLSNPGKTLEIIYSLLKKDGILIIEVPNFGSLQSILSRGRWFHLDPPRHLYEYSSRTLSNLLLKKSYNIYKIKYSSIEYDMFGMIQSLLNIISNRQNLLFDLILKRISVKDIILSKDITLYFDFFTIPFILPFLLIFSIITSYISKCYGLNGDVEIYSKK